MAMRVTPTPRKAKRDLSDPKVSRQLWQAAEQASREEVKETMRRSLRRSSRAKQA